MLQSASSETFDVIIVPGVPFNKKKWDIIMKGRILWAKYLFDNGIARNIMFSGAAVHTSWVESRIMALYAKAVGIPEENIFIEDKAEHSTENVFFSYTKAVQMGFLKIALASDPFQSKLLRKYVHTKVSSQIALLPIVYGKLHEIEHSISDPYIDSSQAYVASFKALKQRENFRKRYRGTRGNNIRQQSIEIKD
ncbi:MAG: YdcF family protein [Bacteroidota bacterium]